MYRTVRVAALSIKPKKWDKPANADKLEAYVRQAARQAPELIVAPEGFLEGYVVMDVVAHPEKAALMHEIAEPRDGPYVRRFRRLARELRVNLCFGFAERVGREVYNCAAFIGPDGQIRGTYHKTYFAEGTHPTWSFNRIGTKLRAFDTALGRAGIVICADRANPLISRALVLDGAQFILIPSYGSRKKWQNEAVLARGREKRRARGASQCRREPDREQGRGRRLQMGRGSDHQRRDRGADAAFARRRTTGPSERTSRSRVRRWRDAIDA